jgi:hypothetical protein
MAAIVDCGMKSRRATAIRVVSFAGTKGDAYFGDHEDRKLKCKCRGGDGGKSKKQKGSRDGDHCGRSRSSPGMPQVVIRMWTCMPGTML